MNEVTVFNEGGQLYADSREIATMIGKEHNKLLRDIRTYIEYLGKSKIGHTEFFIESTYQSEQNKTLPCYLCTKKGCDMIANKMTGEKGVIFTAQYVTAFEKMQNFIKGIVKETPKVMTLGEVVNLMIVTRKAMKEQGSTPREVATALKEIAEEHGVQLPEHFIRPDRTSMNDVRNMVDFIFSHPVNKVPSYDEFIIHHISVKRLDG